MTTTCFPLGQGIPTTIAPSTIPTWSGAPIWWNTTGGVLPFLNNKIDDPRWVGARRITSPGAGTGAGGEQMAFRAVHGPDPSGAVAGECLFLSWYVKVDAALDPTHDFVLVGFYNPALPAPKKAVVAKVIPYNVSVPGAAENANTDFAPNFYEGTLSGTTWTWSSIGSPPAWLDPTSGSGGFTRMWADPATNRWAVEMFLPTTVATAGAVWDGQGVNLGSTFRFFYFVHVGMPVGTMTGHQYPTVTSPPPLLPSNFPKPDSTDWADVQFGGASDPACAAGISIDWSNIGTDTTPPSSSLGNLIKFITPWWVSPAPTQPINVFHAKPWNRSGSTIPLRGIHARFRIANWGSVPDWDDPTLQNQLWTDVPFTGATPTFENPAAIPNNTQGDISFQWQLDTSPGQLPAYAPQPPGTPTKRDHQCMLVELSAGSGATGSLNFVNDSVYKNMEVVPASTFEREADISVKTLGSLGSATHRDVYLYVETLNMPANTTPGQEAARRKQAEEQRAERLRAISRELPPAPGPEIAIEGPGESQGTFEWFVPTMEDIEAEWPMYRVHVWNDTGDTVTEEDGTVRKVLRPQTSFGYMVDHQGDLYGWDHALSGANLQQVAPNFYRLHVPNEGVATVKTTIVGHEKPRPKGWRACLLWLLALLAAIVAFFRKLFK
jgi:hypothetical protein